MCIDTVFICFCEDCEINNGQDQPYFMSRGLMVNRWYDQPTPSVKLIRFSRLFLHTHTKNRNLWKRVKKLLELVLVEIVLGNNNRKGRIITRRWILSTSMGFGTLEFHLLRINSIRLPLLSAPGDKKRKRKEKSFCRHHASIWYMLAINESFVVLCIFFFIETNVPTRTKKIMLT